MPDATNPDMQITTTCPANIYREVELCLPVAVKPFATVQNPTVRCCGGPIVHLSYEPCHGRPDVDCSFTISQRICVAIPVEFGAEVETGMVHIECADDATTRPCQDCYPDVYTDD